MDIPGLSFSPSRQAEFESGLEAIEVNWEVFDRTWPSGVGYQEGAEGGSDKENEWTAVPISE